ncbi:hypothetical protein N7467_003139 [Penicillium canescens]|nr:hypothetical protein N7467_003139 [Penicillium canescens]
MILSVARRLRIPSSDEFTPTGAPKTEGTTVTIGVGVNLIELYTAVGKKGRTVVAGTSHTKGISADNALGFNVVTASVSDRTFLAPNNIYQYSRYYGNLVTALRCGGGGTFSVVVRPTLRTIDEAPVTMVNRNISRVTRHPSF